LTRSNRVCDDLAHKNFIVAVSFLWIKVMLVLFVFVFDVGEEPLQVARCTKIINAGQDNARYMINVKQFARFVVELGDQVAPSDIEEGMRVGYVEYVIQSFYCCVVC